MSFSLTSFVKLYSPMNTHDPVKLSDMGLSGLEPPTSRLSGACSNLLSYKPVSSLDPSRSVPLMEMMGFEPMTPCLQGRCSPN